MRGIFEIQQPTQFGFFIILELAAVWSHDSSELSQTSVHIFKKLTLHIRGSFEAPNTFLSIYHSGTSCSLESRFA